MIPAHEAGPCPTCHEHHPWPWLGHHPVSSGHPEDDDPWCKHCRRPLADMRSDNPADYCTKARPEPAPPEPDHDLHRCDCDACHEDRAEAGWVRNRNHR